MSRILPAPPPHQRHRVGSALTLLLAVIGVSATIVWAATGTLWENGEWDGVSGLASESNTFTTEARTADDFSLDGATCALYSIDRFRGQLFQNSVSRDATIEIYADSGGSGPADAPPLFTYSSFTSAEIGSAFEYPVVEYTFETPGLTLSPGKYWVTVIGLGDGSGVDRAFFATTGNGAVQLEPGYFLSDEFGYSSWTPVASEMGVPRDFAFDIDGHCVSLPIAKAIKSAELRPSGPFTYTLTFTNESGIAATDVTITDIIPSSLSVQTVISSGVAITDTGADPSYVWQVQDLAPGEGGIITITGVVDPSILPGTVLTNTAIISSSEERNEDKVAAGVPPDVPTLVSPANGTLTSTNSLDLEWNSSTGAAGYLLDFDGNTADVGDATTYNTGVLADGTYTWTVAAYNRLKQPSAYADTWSLAVDTTGPPPPALLDPPDGTVAGDNTPTLTWATSTTPDVAGYLLDFNSTVTDVENVTNFTTGVLVDGTYTWTVAAYDTLRNTGDFTDTWSLTVNVEPPEPPTLLSPVNGATTGDITPTLTWAPSPCPNVEGYKVDFDGTLADVGDATEYTTPILADGTFTWTVAAYDLAFTSLYTDVWSFTVDTRVPALTIDKSVVGVGGGAENISLNGMITYTVLLSNTGLADAIGVVMTDMLPLGVGFDSWVEQGSALLAPPGYTIVWGPYAVPAAETYEISWRASVTDSLAFAGLSITNTATFTSANAGSGSDAAAFSVAPLYRLWLPLISK